MESDVSLLRRIFGFFRREEGDIPTFTGRVLATDEDVEVQVPEECETVLDDIEQRLLDYDAQT